MISNVLAIARRAREDSFLTKLAQVGPTISVGRDLRGKFGAHGTCERHAPQSCPKAVRIDTETRRRDDGAQRRAAPPRPRFDRISGSIGARQSEVANRNLCGLLSCRMRLVLPHETCTILCPPLFLRDVREFHSCGRTLGRCVKLGANGQMPAGGGKSCRGAGCPGPPPLAAVLERMDLSTSPMHELL